MTPRDMLDQMIALKAMHDAQGRIIDNLVMEMHKQFVLRPQQAKAEEPPTMDNCAHPKEQRLPAATMGHPNRWQCGICGHQGEGN